MSRYLGRYIEVNSNSADAVGVHYWEGQVQVTQGTAMRLRHWMASGVPLKDAPWSHQDAVNTLVHELYHGASPIKYTAYDGVGAYIEEVTNELMTRLTLHRRFGLSPYQGAYADELDGFTTLVADTLRGNTTRAGEPVFDAVADAAHKFKQRPIYSITSPAEALEAFTDDILDTYSLKPDANRAVLRTKLLDALRDQRIGG